MTPAERVSAGVSVSLIMHLHMHMLSSAGFSTHQTAVRKPPFLEAVSDSAITNRRNRLETSGATSMRLR